MKYSDIIDKVAGEINLPPAIVDKTYRAFWGYIRVTIGELPLKEDYTEEQFLKLKTNFNIPSLGKLSCTYDRYKSVMRKFNYIRKIREKQ